MALYKELTIQKKNLSYEVNSADRTLSTHMMNQGWNLRWAEMTITNKIMERKKHATSTYGDVLNSLTKSSMLHSTCMSSSATPIASGFRSLPSSSSLTCTCSSANCKGSLEEVTSLPEVTCVPELEMEPYVFSI